MLNFFNKKDINFLNIIIYIGICLINSILITAMHYEFGFKSTSSIFEIGKIILVPIFAATFYKKWYYIMIPGALLSWWLCFMFAVIIWKDGI